MLAWQQTPAGRLLFQTGRALITAIQSLYTNTVYRLDSVAAYRKGAFT